MLCGLPTALSLIVTAPVRVPVCVGLNWILNVQVFPASTLLLLAHEPLITGSRKSPLIEIVPIFSVAFPELVSVTVFADEVAPTLVLLKVSEVGESFTLAPFTTTLTLVVWLKLPEVPVIVMAWLPAGAAVVTVKVTTLVEVVGFVPNEAVMPAGRPDAAKVTPLLKPYEGTTVMVLVPVLPGVTVMLVGFAVRLKSGPLTVNDRLMFWVMLPEVPVTVIVAVPVAAVALAFSVSVLVDVPGFGLNDAVTPEGNPVAVKLTLPLNPP